jgi:hypothetical protein
VKIWIESRFVLLRTDDMQALVAGVSALLFRLGDEAGMNAGPHSRNYQSIGLVLTHLTLHRGLL